MSRAGAQNWEAGFCQYSVEPVDQLSISVFPCLGVLNLSAAAGILTALARAPATSNSLALALPSTLPWRKLSEAHLTASVTSSKSELGPCPLLLLHLIPFAIYTVPSACIFSEQTPTCAQVPLRDHFRPLVQVFTDQFLHGAQCLM